MMPRQLTRLTRVCSVYILGIALGSALHSHYSLDVWQNVPLPALAIAATMLVAFIIWLSVGCRHPSSSMRGTFTALAAAALFSGCIVGACIDGSIDLTATDSLASIKHWMRGQLVSSSLPSHASFLESILLGARVLPADLSAEFSRAGVAHILSVSGLHVGFVAAALSTVTSLSGLPTVLRSVCQIVGICGYTLVCGLNPPVLRAAILAVFGMAGVWLGRTRNAVGGLSLAAVLILSIDPAALGGASFQLSFSAAIALATVLPFIKTYLRPSSLDGAHPVFKFAFDSLAVSIAATLGTMPFVAHHFGEVSLISPISNIIAVPLSGLIVVGGMAQIVASAIWLPAGQALGATNGLLIDALINVTHLFARVPMAAAVTGSPPLTVAVLVSLVIPYAAMVAMPGHFPDSAKRGHAKAVFTLAICGAFIVSLYCFGRSGGYPSITFISVGQGDSALIDSGDGMYALVDCGPASFRGDIPDAAKRRIIPLLKRFGIRKLDYLILTHPDFDHIGGAVSILESVKVGSIVRGYDIGTTDAARKLQSVIARLGVPVFVADMGDSIRLGPEVNMRFIWPERRSTTTSLSPSDEGSDPDTNGQCLVAILETAYHKVLMTGDADSAVEEELIEEFGTILDSDILKVGHHGSNGSSSTRFLESVSPEVSVVSVGKNAYGHPHKGLMSRLRNAETTIVRTDNNGHIKINLGQSGMNITHPR